MGLKRLVSIFILTLSGFLVSACGVEQGAPSEDTTANAKGPTAEQNALATELVEEINTLVDADTDRIVAIFKDIHENPELGFMEVRTAGIVAKVTRPRWSMTMS